MAKSDLNFDDLNAFYRQFFSLCPLTNATSYLVAYSGGLDSHVLLHLFASLAKKHDLIKLRSVYIDHGLQDISGAWAKHCQDTADALNIEHRCISLHLKISSGDSLEAVARKARYQALKIHLQTDEVLLTAHHQDDQAETLLLQLLRGAGMDGLAAMPMKARFSQGFHIRPLLDYSKQSLQDYAIKKDLKWITDPSNNDTRFDRNYLRNDIIPRLKQRWPQLASTLSRSAKLQAEASSLLASYTTDEMLALAGVKENTLSQKAIVSLSYIKQKSVIRYWIKTAGFKAPSASKLEHIIIDVFNSVPHANPLIHWQDAEIRRYRDDVYIMSPLPALSILTEHQPLHWDLTHTLSLGEGYCELNPDDLGDLKPVLLEQAISVTVRFRQGGERIRVKHGQHTISLKNVLQEAGIPPWQRQRLPLIYARQQLICVPGVAQVDKMTLGS